MKARPVGPIVLSLAGSSLIFFYLSVFVWALFALPNDPGTPPGGSPNLGIVIIPMLVVAFGTLALIPIILSWKLWFDPASRRSLAIGLIVWYGLMSAYYSASQLFVILTGYRQIDPWFFAGTLTPLLGLAGGIWAFKGRTPAAAPIGPVAT